MRKNSFGENMIAFLAVMGIFLFIGAIGESCEPKCIEAGCDNKQSPESSFCYLHKPYKSKASSYGSSSYGNQSSGTSSGSNAGSTGGSTNSSGTTTNASYGNTTGRDTTTGKSTTTKKKAYESYDDGYDDVYLDGDYDYDRYCNDSDYADGVDEAMDELGDDW